MNKRKWLDYLYDLNMLKETQDDLYIQKLYKLPVRFKIRKLEGGNKSETEDDLRAIASVTSLSLPRDRKADAENWYATMDIKFELDRQIDVMEYIRADLLPAVKAIPGVEVITYGEPEFVYDAQNPEIGKEKQRSREFGGDKEITKDEPEV